MSGAGNLCSQPLLGSRAGKALPRNRDESREQGHAKICAGGKKWASSADLHLQFCSEGSAPLLGQIQRDSPALGMGKRGKKLWNSIWEQPKGSHRSEPAQFVFPSQGKCCCISRNVPVPQTLPREAGQFAEKWERPFQFEPSNCRSHVQLLKDK